MTTETSNNHLFIVGLMLFLAGCLFLYFARRILTPFILAAFFTYLLSPMHVKVLESKDAEFVNKVLSQSITNEEIKHFLKCLEVIDV